MLTAPALKAWLRRRGLALTKRRGQHHLVDAEAIARIVEACRLRSSETVIEIGAGLGALTEPLARRAGRVVAIEIDRGICAALKERLAGVPNVTVECVDVLAFAWSRYPGATVVGAIPYHISSPILVELFRVRRAIAQAVVVLQAELAERLVARPGTKAYGRLTLLAQYGWQVTELLRLPREAFFPRPKVDSACVRLVPLADPPVDVRDEGALFELVRIAFSQRRKTLVNCLRRRGDRNGQRARVQRLVDAMGLPAGVRSEALSLAQFARLSNALGPLNPLR